MLPLYAGPVHPERVMIFCSEHKVPCDCQDCETYFHHVNRHPQHAAHSLRAEAASARATAGWVVVEGE